MKNCKRCAFWIEQNNELIKINAALGERNQALEKLCGDLSYGELSEMLCKLNPDQIKAVKAFAGLLLSRDDLRK